MKKILLVTLLFCLFYSIRLGYPPLPYFDEVFYVPAAKAIGHLSGYLQNRHPPFIHLCMALAMKTGGETAWVWRLPSLVFAGAATALTGYLAFMLTGRIAVFWLTCALLSMDGLWITQARIGLPNAAMVFFIIATVILWIKGHHAVHQRMRWWLLACATAGLAGACKWQGALVIFIPLFFYGAVRVGRKRGLNDSLPTGSPLGIEHAHDEENRRIPVATILIRSIVGMAVFLASYFSVFCIVPFIHGMNWMDILKLQADIPTHHIFISSVHRDASMWYTWPFLVRPVWFGFLNHNPELPAGSQIVDGILCLGNPFHFMLFTPAMVWASMQWIRHRDTGALISLLGVCIFWFPSMIMGKTGLLYHFFPAVPFMTIAIAAMLDHMLESRNAFMPWVATVFLLLIFIAFVFFFPLWTGLPITDTYFQQHLWFSSWK